MAQVFCSNCGKDLDSSSNFCAACGFRVGHNQRQAGQAPPAPTAQHQPPQQSTQPYPAHQQPAQSQQPQPHAPTRAPQQPQGQPPHQQMGVAATQAAGTPSFEYHDHKPHSRIVKHTSTPEEQAAPTIEFQDLHPNARWLFFISYMGTTSIILLLFVGGLLVQPIYFGLALLAYFGALFGASVIAYKNYKFEVSPHSFRKEYGVIHKQSASIPFDQIQNVNIKRGFIDRLLGLCHLEIETAGTGGETKRNIIGGISTGAEGIIPGIAYDEARDLKDLMLARAHAHPVRDKPPLGG